MVRGSLALVTIVGKIEMVVESYDWKLFIDSHTSAASYILSYPLSNSHPIDLDIWLMFHHDQEISNRLINRSEIANI